LASTQPAEPAPTITKSKTSLVTRSHLSTREALACAKHAPPFVFLRRLALRGAALNGGVSSKFA
jgi:hypothetical protein